MSYIFVLLLLIPNIVKKGIRDREREEGSAESFHKDLDAVHISVHYHSNNSTEETHFRSTIHVTFLFGRWRNWCFNQQLCEKMGKNYTANPNDYKLLEEVGYGASATVYRAIYMPSKEVVAVKCLDLDRCNINLVCLFILINIFTLFIWQVFSVYLLFVWFCSSLLCTRVEFSWCLR